MTKVISKSSNDLVICQHCYGAPSLDKPNFCRAKFTTEQLEQFEAFFSDKNNVFMSSYAVNKKTSLLLLELRMG